MRRYFIGFINLVFLTSFLSPIPSFSRPAYGQDGQPGQGPQDQAQDPQGGAGRIAILNGNVSTQRGDSGDWVADTINTPVMPGDTTCSLLEPT